MNNYTYTFEHLTLQAFNTYIIALYKFFTLNTPTMLCKCFSGMSVYSLYTLTTIPPCNNHQSFHTNFRVFIILLQEQIFSTQSVTDNLVLLQFHHWCSQYSFNIAKLSTFNGHVSHFTSGIYDWASLYSLKLRICISSSSSAHDHASGC
jgi:hypothetical protein